MLLQNLFSFHSAHISFFDKNFVNFVNPILRVPVGRSGQEWYHCFCLLLGHITVSKKLSIWQVQKVTYYFIIVKKCDIDIDKKCLVILDKNIDKISSTCLSHLPEATSTSWVIMNIQHSTSHLKVVTVITVILFPKIGRSHMPLLYCVWCCFWFTVFWYHAYSNGLMPLSGLW